MANIHFVLQGKGGVSKSLVAAFLSQYWLSTGHSLVGIDTDPVNSTFSQFKSLPAQRLDILKDGKIDESKFDALMGLFLAQDEATEVVVDNGAASFIPVCDYLLKNQAIQLLQKDGLFGIIHIPKQNGLFAGSLKAMLDYHQTFGDAATDTSFEFMDRHRLSIIRGNLFKEMESVLGRIDHA